MGVNLVTRVRNFDGRRGLEALVARADVLRRLCAAFGLEAEADGMATNAERVALREKVVETVETAFSGLSAPVLLARLAEIGVPAGQVRTLDEVYGWDQTLSQGLVVDVEHPTLGKVSLPGPPLRFFTPHEDGEIETTPTRHRPPLLDQDAEAVRAWLETL